MKHKTLFQTRKQEWTKGSWTIFIVAVVIDLLVIFGMYIVGNIAVDILLQRALILIVVSLLISIFVSNLQKGSASQTKHKTHEDNIPIAEQEPQKTQEIFEPSRSSKLVYIQLGAALGFIITFFGGGLLLGLVPLLLFGHTLLADGYGLLFFLHSFLVAPLIGASIMYYVGKRRNFKIPLR